MPPQGIYWKLDKRLGKIFLKNLDKIFRTRNFIPVVTMCTCISNSAELRFQKSCTIFAINCDEKEGNLLENASHVFFFLFFISFFERTALYLKLFCILVRRIEDDVYRSMEYLYIVYYIVLFSSSPADETISRKPRRPFAYTIGRIHC